MTQISPENSTIGFVGIGVMGRSMAGHILDAGYRVHVHTRTPSKAETILEKGALWEGDIAELAKKCQVIITMVGYPRDVEQIYLGKDGILENAKPGTLVIDMTTSNPALAGKIHEKALAVGIKALDAPVSGGDIGARNGTLSIMAGGDGENFDMALPLLELMGKNICLQGCAGSGQHTKMVNQISVAAGMVGLCESLTYARAAGLDPETVLKNIGTGAAGSWAMNNLGPRIIKGDFAPGFYVKHFIKDMGIALESAREMGIDLPGLALAKSLYDTLAASGFENEGTQVLYKLVANMDGRSGIYGIPG
ncbi:MAG: NAD(P)-dependent oxidoreductase [Desulfamplus sp.]|nr:NAD(P)-dependent oxidoreductase [Desulfamplus sp.]